MELSNGFRGGNWPELPDIFHRDLEIPGHLRSRVVDSEGGRTDDLTSSYPRGILCFIPAATMRCELQRWQPCEVAWQRVASKAPGEAT